MTISKERLSELALEVATNSQVFTEALMGDYETGITNFAHALLKRVEQESEVVGYSVQTAKWLGGDNYEPQISLIKDERPNATKLIALPLVSEE